MQPTEQQTTDTRVALSHWWCGTDFGEIARSMDDPSFTAEVVKAAELFSDYDDMTIEVLTLWRGYLDASTTEGTIPSVEDFILATYVVQQEE